VKRSLLVLIMLVILTLLLPGCQGSSQVGNDRFETIRECSSVLLYPGPQPEMLGPLGNIPGGSRVEVLEDKGDWLHVMQDDKEGWLPKWYTDRQAQEKISDVSQEPFVLKENTKGRLFPGGPEIVDLQAGKLLTPVQEWNDWYYVNIIVYDIPSVQYAWLPKNLLAEVSLYKPLEGFLRQGTKVYMVDSYDRIAGSKSTEITYEMTVLITQKQGEFVRVTANGGWTAWTEEKNVTYTKSKPLNNQAIMALFFPENRFTEEAGGFRDQDGKLYRIVKAVSGTFVAEDQDQIFVIVEVAEGLSHAEGFYQAYAGIVNNQGDILLSQVKQFSADEGQIAIFTGNQRSYILFAGNTTFNGWTGWTGGLWKAGKTWTAIWPQSPDFWEHTAVEIEGESLKILKRKVQAKSDQLIPDYSWEFAYYLDWDKNKENFVRRK